MFERVPQWFTGADNPRALLDDLKPEVAAYLAELKFESRIKEIRANVSTLETFVARFFRWFDAFRLFKFLRWGEVDLYQGEALTDAVLKLLEWSQASPKQGNIDVLGLLHHLRALDRNGVYGPTAKRM